MHEVDLLFECVLIRDGVTALWFPRSDVHVQSIVNALCEVVIVRCFCMFSLYRLFVFFLSPFAFCVLFHFLHYFVYLGTIYIIINK